MGICSKIGKRKATGKSYGGLQIMKEYIMALDQGTTSSRCILFDHAGKIVTMAQKEFTQIYPQPGWVEQNPREIWSSQMSVAIEAMANIGASSKNIRAIGITNQRETTIVWDKKTGEPVYNAIVWQCRRTAEQIDELKEKGIHVCLDSNGGLWNEDVEELFRLTDLVLLDIKEFNPNRHQTLTGRSNEQTIRTAAWLEENEKPFWLRYVLVPGYSDFEEDIRRLGEALGKYKMVQRVEILPYHTLGVHKYEAMEQEYKLKDVKENTPEQLEKAAEVFKEYFTTVVVN